MGSEPFCLVQPKPGPSVSFSCVRLRRGRSFHSRLSPPPIPALSCLTAAFDEHTRTCVQSMRLWASGPKVFPEGANRTGGQPRNLASGRLLQLWNPFKTACWPRRTSASCFAPTADFSSSTGQPERSDRVSSLLSERLQQARQALDWQHPDHAEV